MTSRIGRIHRRTGIALLLALATLAAALSAPAAPAATVAYNTTNDLVTYTAGAGEANTLAATFSGSTYTITDTTATEAVTDSASICTVTDNTPPTVTTTCTDPGTGENVDALTISLGNLDDSFTAATVNRDAFTLNGGDGADTITASQTSDVLNGDNGNDILDGDDGNDDINGGADAGYDRLTGGDNDDDLDGGPGVDRALYETSTGNTTIDMDNNADDSDGFGDDDNVRDSIESITGSNLNDTLTGSCFANVLAGQGGNDTLNGDPTTCAGGYGGDFMGGGTGNDPMRGSLTPIATDGVDRVTYTTSTAAINVKLDGTANDTDGVGSTADNVGRDIEWVYGGPLGDTISACGAGAPTGTGNCSATGASGALQAVMFFGGAGNDTLWGSDFNDFLDGQAGNDPQNCLGGVADQFRIDAADLPVPTNCEVPTP